ncbi:MAG: hypothetical protein LBB85_04280 [Dysgonamonadaceae bacterium]|jgi:hypothetical protein|nr:hypothetical protein [Dysgonamonadaceae bacterium]
MNTFHKLLFFLGIVIFMTSCGPVHRFTRIKKIPREYSLNYCTGEVKAPKTDLNKEPWIVYSDREKNFTLSNAGGKVKAKDADFLDPFLVIKKKGEYLRLIKYTPDILKNGKLDYKKAEYSGWIHKSKLLLNQQSVTDIASGRKIKMLTLFADTVPLVDPDKYFVLDSMKTYRDLEFNSSSAIVAPYSIVYQLKLLENEEKILIAKKSRIKPETAKNDILGWIDHSLVKDAGIGLHVDLSTIPGDSLQFVVKKEQLISLSEDLAESVRFLSAQHKTLQYNPVSSYSVRDSLIAFKTRAVAPLFDYSNNYVFNVNGEHITRKEFKNLSKELKKINISFVFEGQEQTIEQFPQIVNAIQSLQPLFEQDNTTAYQFNCVLAFDDGQTETLTATGMYSGFADLMNYLSLKADRKDQLRPVKLDRPWQGLNMAVNLLDRERNATNLIVLVGDKGYASDRVDSTLIRKLLHNNCRICAFQIYAGNEDEYNNFVLAVENMITSYADALLQKRKNIFVSAGQVKRSNYYREMDAGKNSFRLDFPGNSITQGCLFFPQKREILPLEYMASDIDTIIRQIQADNNDIIQQIAKAFHSFGNNRTLYDSLYISHFGLSGIPTPTKPLLSKFGNATPGWYLPSKTIILTDSINKRLDYFLLLSETEMKEMKEFIKSLSAVEVDLKYRSITKQAKKKACNCPEDDLFAAQETVKTAADTLLPRYANTKKVRRRLYGQYIQTIKYCKLCKEKVGQLKSLTLAQAQYRITGCPTSTEILNRVLLKDIKNKKRFPDQELDQLIDYFKSKLPDLEKAEQFESGGEIYYWLDKKYLP